MLWFWLKYEEKRLSGIPCVHLPFYIYFDYLCENINVYKHLYMFVYVCICLSGILKKFFFEMKAMCYLIVEKTGFLAIDFWNFLFLSTIYVLHSYFDLLHIYYLIRFNLNPLHFNKFVSFVFLLSKILQYCLKIYLFFLNSIAK